MRTLVHFLCFFICCCRFRSDAAVATVDAFGNLFLQLKRMLYVHRNHKAYEGQAKVGEEGDFILIATLSLPK